jgi:hypothetical protein
LALPAQAFGPYLILLLLLLGVICRAGHCQLLHPACQLLQATHTSRRLLLLQLVLLQGLLLWQQRLDSSSLLLLLLLNLRQLAWRMHWMHRAAHRCLRHQLLHLLLLLLTWHILPCCAAVAAAAAASSIHIHHPIHFRPLPPLIIPAATILLLLLLLVECRANATTFRLAAAQNSRPAASSRHWLHAAK